MNTKDLFELAQIMSDAYDDSGIDRGDVVAWADLDPAEQAAYAEGIRAVVEELQRRGWGLLGYTLDSLYRWRYPEGGPVTPSEYYMPTSPFGTSREARTVWYDRPYRPLTIEFPTPYYGAILRDGSLVIDKPGSVPPLPEALEKIEELVEAAEKLTAPRSWSRIQDVPPFILTTDNEGDFWKTDDDGDVFIRCQDEDEFSRVEAWELDDDNRTYGPFTEVVEKPEPAPIELADWEKALVNPDGPWNRWQDVPEGVKYSPAGQAGTTYVNRNGLRKAVFRDGERTSMSTDATVQSRAPFKRVVD